MVVLDGALLAAENKSFQMPLNREKVMIWRLPKCLLARADESMVAAGRWKSTRHDLRLPFTTDARG
jgi:hypothetical protein